MKFKTKILVLLATTVLLTSCGSTKKTKSVTNESKKTDLAINSEIKETKKEVVDTTSSKKAAETTEKTTDTKKTEVKTKVVLQTEKDSAGNLKPAKYTNKQNGKVKSEITITGNGQVIVETTETDTSEKSTSNSEKNEKINSSSKKESNHDKSTKIDIRANETTDKRQLDISKKTSNFFLFQWWFWLIVVIIALFFWWLNKKFFIFGRIKNLINPKK